MRKLGRSGPRVIHEGAQVAALLAKTITALRVIAMLAELGRYELVPVWLDAAVEMTRRRRNLAA
jgi:hypothetical protein